MKIYDIDDPKEMDALVDDIFNRHVEACGGPAITPDMSYRERCILEFNWVHQQEKIAKAMVEGIRHVAAGGKFH